MLGPQTTMASLILTPNPCSEVLGEGGTGVQAYAEPIVEGGLRGNRCSQG